MAQAILVIGAESSGNKLMTSILISFGFKGYLSQTDNFDVNLPLASEYPQVVIRRSYPYGAIWPDLPKLCTQLSQNGYKEIIAVVNMRNMYATAKSQILRGHVKSYQEAIESTRKAYKLIFSQLMVLGIDFYIMSYDELIRRPAVMLRALCQDLGLDFKAEIIPLIVNENTKHYE